MRYYRGGARTHVCSPSDAETLVKSAVQRQMDPKGSFVRWCTGRKEVGGKLAKLPPAVRQRIQFSGKRLIFWSSFGGDLCGNLNGYKCPGSQFHCCPRDRNIARTCGARHTFCPPGLFHTKERAYTLPKPKKIAHPMQVILHTGAHCTDEDRLLKGVLRNAESWRHAGVAIPGPSRYRNLLTEAMNKLRRDAPSPDTRDLLLDAILQEDAGDLSRLVLSNDNFFSVPKLMFQNGYIYHRAEERLSTMAKVFEGDELNLFMGLRDPASFLPAAFAATPHDDFATFMEGVDPMRFRWSDLIRRISATVPNMPITLWCNEDTPFLWGQIMRELAGIALNRKITGAFDLYAQIISREGMQRFRAFLKENPTITERQKRRVMIAFLDKYALDDMLEDELDLPGWDAAYVDMLTEIYEYDLEIIAALPNVRLLTPDT